MQANDFYNTKIYLYLLAIAFLSSCGGGGGSSKPDSNSGNQPLSSVKSNQSQSSAQSSALQTAGTHKVELGLISGAKVFVYAQDHKTILFQTSTDNTGVFKIDVNAITKKRTDLNIQTPFVWVESSGGYDLDPNDDGKLEAGEAVPLNGAVTSIVKYDRLVTEKGFKFNLITSIVADLLSNSDDINDERINQLAEQLIIPDKNKDNKLDDSDMLQYQMGTFSDAEKNLRPYYLVAIHENNSNIRNTSVQVFKENIETIRLEQRVVGSTIQIIPHALDKNTTIYYEKNKKIANTTMLLNRYSEGRLSIKSGEGIAFQECLSNDITTCYARQNFTYMQDDKKLYLPDPKKSNDPYSDPVKIKQIIDNVNAKGDALTSASQEYESANRMVNYYSDQAASLQTQIDALTTELNKL